MISGPGTSPKWLKSLIQNSTYMLVVISLIYINLHLQNVEKIKENQIKYEKANLYSETVSPAKLNLNKFSV
jgi:hypothetical protein